MSLAHAILGILSKAPMSGYDLKTRWFDDRIAHFWPADQAQVYRTLDRMREARWVGYDLEVQQDRPDRKVHRITEAGRTELRRWLKEERPDLPPVRDPFLVQLFFADVLADGEIREALTHRRELHAARLRAYEAVPLPTLRAPGVPREERLMRMTLERGLAAERAALAWVDACLAAVEDAPPDPKETPADITWRLRLRSPPQVVHQALATAEGRRTFWAEDAPESDGVIRFRFSNGEELTSRIVENAPPRRLAVTYFGGSVATFTLADDGAGGTDLTLTETGVPAEALEHNRAGWVSVLLALKAAIDHGVDLRNGDPSRSWDDGYVDG